MRFWTRAARPQGEGQDGPSQSHPLRRTDLIAGAASGTLAARVERWPSGRRRTPGKCVTPNRVRGFDKIAGAILDARSAPAGRGPGWPESIPPPCTEAARPDRFDSWGGLWYPCGPSGEVAERSKAHAWKVCNT